VPSDALPFHYVAVDGPIGVGKTTLVELLTQRFEGVKLFEDVDNPFLADFYREKPGSAFQTELYFLLTRFKQQQDAIQRELFDRLLLADYTFQKNRIFAYLNLDDSELLLFDKLYAMLEPQVPAPDLVIYLVADLDTCLARIKKRRLDSRSQGSPNFLEDIYEAEKEISPDYLAELIDAYNHYYHYYERSPLLVVETRNLDFPQRPEDLDELVHRLARPIKGTEYFVPLGSRKAR
jgi:deoxyguanosine kinase